MKCENMRGRKKDGGGLRGNHTCCTNIGQQRKETDKSAMHVIKYERLCGNLCSDHPDLMSFRLNESKLKAGTK